jgi:hypothetical protein
MNGLTKKVKCEWCGDGILSNSSIGTKRPTQFCPFCGGTGIQEIPVYIRDYEGNFHAAEINENGIYDFEDDMWVGFNCPCGEEISMIDGIKICKCGRIYRLQYEIDVDETHIGEIDWLIQESNKK